MEREEFVEKCKEVIETFKILWEMGVIAMDDRVHMRESDFLFMFPNSEISYHEGDAYPIRHFIIIDGIEFFCLSNVPKELIESYFRVTEKEEEGGNHETLI